MSAHPVISSQVKSRAHEEEKEGGAGLSVGLNHHVGEVRSGKKDPPGLRPNAVDAGSHYPPTPAEERGSAPGITGVGVLTMDAGACESLVARSVPVLRFTGYGWARMY